MNSMQRNFFGRTIGIVSFIMVILFVAILSVEAQSSKVNFQHIENEENLSQSTVNCILRDSIGFFWFGTEDGLNLYDGNRMKVYKHENSDTGSISSSAIWSIFEDSKGSLWIGTFNGLNRYNRKMDAFESYHHTDDRGSLSDNYVRSIIEDVSGNIWVGCNNGLNRMNEDGKTFSSYFYGNVNPKGIGGMVIHSMLIDHLGKLWIATGDGLWVYDETRDTFSNFDLPSKFRNNSILSIYEDESGLLWLGTQQYGLFRFDRTKLSFVPVSFYGGDGQFIEEINVISGDGEGVLLVGTNEGLVFYDTRSEEYELYSHHPLNPNSIGDSDVKCIYTEKNNFVWIGTINGGVNIINPFMNRFGLISSGNGDLGTFNNSMVRFINEGEDSNILLGIVRRGLQVYDRQRGTFSEFEGTVGRFLRNKTVGNMFIDDRNYWFYVRDEGVFIYDRVLDKFRNISDILLGDEKFEEAVLCFMKDRNGEMWIGTNGSGLFRYDEKSGRSVRYVYDANDLNSIGSDRVFSIIEDRDGTIWIATAGGGLNRFIREEDRFEAFCGDPLDNNRTFNYILSVHEDKDGNIWAGTFGNGLIKYEKGKDSFCYFLEEDGLPNNVIYGILEDAKGHLWLSHNQGITKFNPKEETFVTYDKRDGLQGNEFNSNGNYLFRNGYMAFNGINGINIFHPDSIYRDTIPPKIVFTELKIANKEINPQELYNGREVLSSSISTSESIHLNHSDREIYIEFAALDYAVPGKNEYKYRFEGRDDEWIPLGTLNHISFYKLPQRKTVLHVIGSNSSGTWNEEGVKINIYVRPPFYNTYLFYVLLFLGLSAAIVSAYFRKTQKLKFKNKELEGLIQSKTREIVHQKDILELKNEELENQNRIAEEQRIKTSEMAERLDQANKSKLQFFTNISHEFRTPLSLIIGFTEKLLNESGMSQKEREEDYRLIDKNANKLLKLINRLMHFRKLSVQENRLRISENDLVKVVHDQAVLYKNLADQKSVSYIFESIPESIHSWFDVEQFEEVITNLISNAFKYSPEHSTIRIRVGLGSDPVLSEMIGESTKDLKDYTYFFVEDTGEGIPEDKQSLVFKRFYQNLSDSDKHEAGTGIGLHIANMIVKQHRGEIILKSKVGEGSTFAVLLKNGKDHLSDFEIVDAVVKEKRKDIPEEILLEESDGEGVDGAAFSKTIEKLSKTDLPEVLVIEDNHELRKFINKGLSSEFSILEAEHDAQAQRVLEESNPEIIICDVLLPGKRNGFDIVEGLKSNINTSHIPVIMLTALDSIDQKILGLEKGADIYLTKPFSMRELQAHIHRLIASRNVLQKKFREHAFLKSRELEISDKDESFIQKIIRIIEAGMSDPKFNVTVLCDAMNMSQTKLYRKVKALTDITISDFIRGLRLRKAASMLLETDKNVSEIAYEVGFNDPNYFGKCFKVQFGCSPSEFVKEQKPGSGMNNTIF